jgi:hypothetical protein
LNKDHGGAASSCPPQNWNNTPPHHHAPFFPSVQTVRANRRCGQKQEKKTLKVILLYNDDYVNSDHRVSRLAQLQLAADKW